MIYDLRHLIAMILLIKVWIEYWSWAYVIDQSGLWEAQLYHNQDRAKNRIFSEINFLEARGTEEENEKNALFAVISNAVS